MSDDPASVARTVAEQLSAARRDPPSRPTYFETEMAKTRAQLLKVCKYPLREWVVLTPAQLAAARRQLGAAGLNNPGEWGGDRRPLTADELRQARAAAGMTSTGWERDC